VLKPIIHTNSLDKSYLTCHNSPPSYLLCRVLMPDLITNRRSIANSENEGSVTSVESASERMSDHKMSDHKMSDHGIELEPAKACDQDFLYQVFASTRMQEMAITGWSEEQQRSFLSMQYEAQRSSYLTQVPEARYSIILCDGVAAGRLIVDRTAQEIHIVDIALLPEFRKLGIGSAVMSELLEEASVAGKQVRLYVERFNPALHWYERLGFSALSTGPIYFEMVWCSSRQVVGGGDRIIIMTPEAS
jgi:ribosomal protein S18 acetylase RimI-like enzyme